MLRRAASARAAGEGYGRHDEATLPIDAAPAPSSARAASAEALSAAVVARASAPILLVVALNYWLSTWLFPALDTAYLAEPRFGSTDITSVRGLWAVIVALSAAIVLLIVLQRRRLSGLVGTLELGASSSVLPLFNTASQVGFGAVIASLAGFELIRDAVLGIAPGNPLVSLAISVNILAGVTGSASGGMMIALQTLGDTWLAMGQAAGIAPDLLHRITAIAAGGLDALPHNGAVITLLAICGLTHRQSYLDVFVVAVFILLLALVVAVLLGTAFGSF